MVDSGDLEVMEYFFLDKGDITRWCHWNEKKEDIRKQYPDLMYWTDRCLELDAWRELGVSKWKEYMKNAKDDMEARNG